MKGAGDNKVVITVSVVMIVPEGSLLVRGARATGYSIQLARLLETQLGFFK
jgi:hypothetical protein